MTQNTDRNRRPRRLLATVLALAAVGVVVVVVAISTAGGGSNAAGPRAAGGQPTAAVHVAKTNGHAKRVVNLAKAKTPAATTTKSPAPKAAAKPSSAIPQNNGGDSDPDNNGGPSDGDGDI